MSDILAAAREDARANGLRYLGDDHPGITRRPFRGRFAYTDANGKAVNDKATLDRIRKLAIPPAWTGVWISPAANGHLQATGRDQRGRKQYRYHADFRAARDRTKYEHVLEFGAHIEKVRERVDADMRRPGLPREKVLATIVHLLDTTLIRVGNDEYARANGSFGLTTLKDRHVKVEGGQLRFEFKGKSGKAWRLAVQDRRVAKIVKSCQELPGQHLFQYLDENGAQQSVGSADVNAYLHEITGAEVTAKDFRTFAGTVLAATTLLRFKPVESETEAKVNVRAAIEEVAERLGNTPAICRKCYIHPEIMAAYLAGALAFRLGKSQERAVLRFLSGRLHKASRKRAVTTPAEALAA
ncbi:MAG TPA: DNA topoisomerase IB [Bauldia sp.]|nr:DNA topoisomerase IB [Bauldia sp.]